MRARKILGESSKKDSVGDDVQAGPSTKGKYVTDYEYLYLFFFL